MIQGNRNALCAEVNGKPKKKKYTSNSFKILILILILLDTIKNDRNDPDYRITLELYHTFLFIYKIIITILNTCKNTKKKKTIK